jgi:hypothetical protein
MLNTAFIFFSGSILQHKKFTCTIPVVPDIRKPLCFFRWIVQVLHYTGVNDKVLQHVRKILSGAELSRKPIIRLQVFHATFN